MFTRWLLAFTGWLLGCWSFIFVNAYLHSHVGYSSSQVGYSQVDYSQVGYLQVDYSPQVGYIRQGTI